MLILCQSLTSCTVTFSSWWLNPTPILTLTKHVLIGSDIWGICLPEITYEFYIQLFQYRPWATYWHYAALLCPRDVGPDLQQRLGFRLLDRWFAKDPNQIWCLNLFSALDQLLVVLILLDKRRSFGQGRPFSVVYPWCNLSYKYVCENLKGSIWYTVKTLISSC